MYRAIRSPCPAIDEKIKQEMYHKHLASLHGMRACIDTSRPPTVPRLVMWRKRMNQEQARMRKVQSENMRIIKSSAQERAKTRASLPAYDVPDWQRELPYVKMELMHGYGMSKTPTKKREEFTLQLFSPPREKKDPFEFKLKREVIKDDGMMVVDQRPKPMIAERRKPKLMNL